MTTTFARSVTCPPLCRRLAGVVILATRGGSASRAAAHKRPTICYDADQSSPPQSPTQGSGMTKIFTATLGTETNTFSALPTGLRLFEETCLFRQRSYGDKVPMFGAPLEVWRRMADARGWQTVESLCAFAMPAGRTVRRVYESFRDEILADLE